MIEGVSVDSHQFLHTTELPNGGTKCQRVLELEMVAHVAFSKRIRALSSNSYSDPWRYQVLFLPYVSDLASVVRKLCASSVAYPPTLLSSLPIAPSETLPTVAQYDDVCVPDRRL